MTARTPVVHLKDFAGQKSDKMYALIGVDDGDKKEETTQEFEFRPVGYGLQKFPEILEAATESGASGWLWSRIGPPWVRPRWSARPCPASTSRASACDPCSPAADAASRYRHHLT